jgi:hypothetical protein
LDKQPEFLNFKNYADVNDGLTQQTYLNMQLANTLATEIFEGLEALEAVCLRRLGAVSLSAADTQDS